MRVVNQLAAVDADVCNGCGICEKVCPVLAIAMGNRPEGRMKLAVVDSDVCVGCNSCEQRCPTRAITMEYRKELKFIGVSLDDVDYAQISELCRKAKLHPEQVACYCTGTRAEEIAAAILKGAKSPEEVSAQTGARTGCKVECIQPILRLLEAAGLSPEPPKGGWQWYGRTPTAWEIPEAIKEKYSNRGFYFEDDIEILERVVNAPLQNKE